MKRFPKETTMGNRIMRTVLFAAFTFLSISAFGAGAARFGTLRNSDWVVTNAWQAVSNKTHDLILEIGQGDSLPPDWQNVSNAAMNAVQSLQPAYDYTDSALISFSSTGSVFRSLSYGTQNYWTDYTGCVWEVGLALGNPVSDTPGAVWLSYEYWPDDDLGKAYMKLNGVGWEQYVNLPEGWTSFTFNGEASKSDYSEWTLPYDVTFVRRLEVPVTNLVGRVALTNDIFQAISTNNEAFVSAVLAAPLVGADPSDLAEIAEYGSYGTVSAAILALIAGLAALKRRIASAETSISEKASLADLPYALVTPGKWKITPAEVEGDVLSISLKDYGDGDLRWDLYRGSTLVTSFADEDADDMSIDFGDVFGIGNVTATRASLPGHLLDRAVNEVSVTDTTTLILPALVNAGKARDFLVRLEISGSTVPTITFQGQGSEEPNGVDEITYETDGDEFPVPDEAGTWLYSFTETAAHTFAVSLKQLQSVSQPVTQGGL